MSERSLTWHLCLYLLFLSSFFLSFVLFRWDIYYRHRLVSFFLSFSLRYDWPMKTLLDMFNLSSIRSVFFRLFFVSGRFLTWQLFMAPSRFIRFFSRRHTKPTSTISKEKSPIKNGLICTIHLLDGEEIHFEIEV